MGKKTIKELKEIGGTNPKKWTYDACYNLAKECKTKKEFQEKSASAYRSALVNDWLKDYNWFLSTKEALRLTLKTSTKIKWNYENCREAALKFKTLKDFRDNYRSAESMSRRKGWLKDFDWLSRSESPYTDKMDNVYAYIFEEQNSVYIGRTINLKERDLAHRSSNKSTVFKFALSLNIPIPEMTILEKDLTLSEGLEKEDYYRNKYEQEGWNVLNIAKTGLNSGSLGSLGRKWTREICYEEAKKYKTLKEFTENSYNAYNAAYKNGWLDDYTWLETIRNSKHEKGYWNYDRCFEEAKKYKTRKELQVGNASAYDSALRHGWLDDYTWILSTKDLLDYDTCFKIAKKYTRLVDFRKNDLAVLERSIRKGWFKDYTWIEKKKIKTVLQYSLFGEFIKKYPGGAKEASEITGFSKSSIIGCCLEVTRLHQGYFWCYEGDEWKINEKVKTIIFKYDKNYNLVGTFLTINSASSESIAGNSTFYSITKYIDTGKPTPDGYYYYHGPHEFTDDEQNKNQDPET